MNFFFFRISKPYEPYRRFREQLLVKVKEGIVIGFWLIVKGWVGEESGRTGSESVQKKTIWSKCAPWPRRQWVISLVHVTNQNENKIRFTNLVDVNSFFFFPACATECGH